jgi:hypothetical protein
VIATLVARQMPPYDEAVAFTQAQVPYHAILNAPTDTPYDQDRVLGDYRACAIILFDSNLPSDNHKVLDAKARMHEITSAVRGHVSDVAQREAQARASRADEDEVGRGLKRLPLDDDAYGADSSDSSSSDSECSTLTDISSD